MKFICSIVLLNSPFHLSNSSLFPLSVFTIFEPATFHFSLIRQKASREKSTGGHVIKSLKVQNVSPVKIFQVDNKNLGWKDQIT